MIWLHSNVFANLPLQSPSQPEPSITPQARLQPALPLPGYEEVTKFDQQGFPTVITVPIGEATVPKQFDDRGFLVTPAPSPEEAIMAQQAGAGSDDVNIFEDGDRSDADDSEEESAAWALSSPTVHVWGIMGAITFFWILIAFDGAEQVI